MKITKIKAAGLRGRTPEGGWANEIKPDDCVHTLIAVYTDEGVTGWGSAFTNDKLVQAALDVLAPLYTGENPVETERVSEKLHANTFWLGRGGSITHAISGIDIAMWDIRGKVTQQSVGTLLGGRYRERVRPYASLLMQQPEPLADHLRAIRAQGFRAFKIGWGPFGRHSHDLDEHIVRAAREAVGTDALLMVDAGASDAFWRQGYKWAVRTAEMLAAYKVEWFEEALPPDNLADYVLLRQNSPVPIAGGEVLTRRQSFLALDHAGRLRCSAAGCDQGRWLKRIAQNRLIWPKITAFASSLTDGIQPWDWLPIFTWRRPLRAQTWWSTLLDRPSSTTSSTSRGGWMEKGCCRFHGAQAWVFPSTSMPWKSTQVCAWRHEGQIWSILLFSCALRTAPYAIIRSIPF